MSQPDTPPEPPDLLEIHREIERLLSNNPAMQLVGIGRNDPDLPQYITISVRYNSAPPVAR